MTRIVNTDYDKDIMITRDEALTMIRHSAKPHILIRDKRDAKGNTNITLEDSIFNLYEDAVGAYSFEGLRKLIISAMCDFQHHIETHIAVQDSVDLAKQYLRVKHLFSLLDTDGKIACTFEEYMEMGTFPAWVGFASMTQEQYDHHHASGERIRSVRLTINELLEIIERARFGKDE